MIFGDNGILDGVGRNHDPDYYDDDNDGTDLAQVRQAEDRASQQHRARHFAPDEEDEDDEEHKY